jgi:hypothetical protein
MSNTRIRRLAAPAVAVVALAVAGSAAGARPDDRAGPRGVDPTRGSIQLRSDDRPGIRGVAVTSGGGFKTGAYGAPSAISLAPPTSGTYTGMVDTPHSGIASDGFDWRSAGAGVASAFGLVMLLGTAALNVRRSHRRAGTAG